MERLTVNPRPDWQARAHADGFHFHTFDDGPYWDENHAYRFTLREVEEDLEDVTDELYAMCLEFVGSAVHDERQLARLRIPEAHWAFIRDAWMRGERGVYGRMDFSYDGRSPAKLLEFNADTPTSVFEAAWFQWDWLEQAMEHGIVPAGSDQFNSLHERLIEAFAALPVEGPLHLASCEGSEEDRATVEYLADCALQAGLDARVLQVEQIGVDAGGQFNDADDAPIRWLFKLYPWEWIFTDPYSGHLAGCDTHFIEPPWKALLSNKGMLACLWEMFPNHPNLLPTYFEDEPGVVMLGESYARKPLFAREGANVSLFRRGEPYAELEGPYGAEGHVRQALAPLPRFGDGYTLIGSWIANGMACGMGLREDTGPITTDDARFVPHFIAD